MSAPARRAKVERSGAELSVRRQCALLNVARSGVYRPRPEGLRRRSGSDAPDRRAVSGEAVLRLAQDDVRPQRGRSQGRRNRKRVQRLMRVMGLVALVPRPGTSKAAPGQRDLPLPAARRVDHRAETTYGRPDITYIPMANGFLYLVAIIDWASRAVLAWRLSNTMDSAFCVEGCWRRLLYNGTVNREDIQHRPRRAIHQRGIHRQAGGGGDRDLNGRARPLRGQHLPSSVLALDQSSGWEV